MFAFISETTPDDIKYLIKVKERTDKIMVLSRIAFTIIGLILIVLCIKEMATGIHKPLFYVSNSIFLAIGLYLSFIDVFVSRMLKFKAQSKNLVEGQKRSYVFGKDGVTETIVNDGTKFKFKYKNIDKGYIHNNTLYLHISNTLKYLVIHNNNGSDLNAIASFLKSKEIVIKSKG